MVGKEIRLLSNLASSLNMTVPAPQVLGTPCQEFSAPYWGHTYLPGATADTLDLNPAQRGGLAGDLGEFLRQLHAIRPANAASIGFEIDIGRGGLPHNQQRARECLPIIHQALGEGWSRRLRAFINSPPEGEAETFCPIHGDLYSRHLILSRRERLTAVIDWGGACIADPALDLSVAYTFLQAEHRVRFWAAYGNVDAFARLRARYLGVCRYGVRALAYAIVKKDSSLAREALFVIKNNC